MSTIHALLDKIAHDPALYAIRVCVGFFLFLIVFVLAYGQTEIQVGCKDGICYMKESDLDKLQQIVNALINKIQELEGKSGCT